MNNKGFMMAEVIVVASIILVALVGLYTSYNKIFSIYNQRVDYYDVATLYELASIRDGIDFSLNNTSTEEAIYSSIESLPEKYVYYIKKDEVNNLITSTKIRTTFKEYLQFLSKGITIETDNILVMEKCIDTDNCKYAYLEVFE